MAPKTSSRLRRIGKLLLILGVLMLLSGCLLLIFLPCDLAFWLAVGSVAVNAAGIVLLTCKVRLP